MASLEGAIESLTRGVVDAPPLTVGISAVAALPLTILIVGRILGILSNVSGELATAILGFMGFLGAVAQFIGGSRISQMNRSLNGAEILVPMAISSVTAITILWFTLPPSRFSESTRDTLRAVGLMD